MKIITFSHQKGGVGKSTLSINVAISLQQKKNRVALLDFDVQNTTFKIVSSLDNLDVYTSDEDIKNTYNYLIVDTPPYIDAHLEELYNQSDLILIPFKVSPLDIIHAQATIDLIRKVQKKNTLLDCRLVVNQLIFNTSLLESLQDEIDALQVPALKTHIQNRTSFIRSIVQEKGIFGTKDSKAIMQVESLTKEILNILK